MDLMNLMVPVKGGPLSYAIILTQINGLALTTRYQTLEVIKKLLHGLKRLNLSM